MKKFKVRKVTVSALIDALLKAEEDGLEYVNLNCVSTDEGDGVSIEKYATQYGYSTPLSLTEDLEPLTDEYIKKLINT